ncbi:GIY-YIG nuclease family protein [Lonsdalea quercina]|uniref:GIY-YIG nuclease family protein n=1 Tax=Lonsdalea quercina TaxID=71657 RepID=UPI003975F9AA
MQDAPSPGWFVYMLRTAGGMLYTGITTDTARRLAQHQAGKGARALRGKGELSLVYRCEASSRSVALQWEYRLKQLSKTQKERLVHDQPESVAHFLDEFKRD